MRLRRTSALLILLLNSVGAAPAALAGNIKVIANPALHISEISVEQLRAIFLGTATSLKDTGPVQPVLDKDGTNLSQFAAAYLGKTGTALETYYRSLLFTGKGSTPMSFASDAEVIAYVAKTRGAIGFVRETTPAEQVKTLKVK